ncbi:hypothetical protein ACOME3_010170 [Neoechinorhynchus agilis]
MHSMDSATTVNTVNSSSQIMPPSNSHGQQRDGLVTMKSAAITTAMDGTITAVPRPSTVCIINPVTSSSTTTNSSFSPNNCIGGLNDPSPPIIIDQVNDSDQKSIYQMMNNRCPLARKDRRTVEIYRMLKSMAITRSFIRNRLIDFKRSDIEQRKQCLKTINRCLTDHRDKINGCLEFMGSSESASHCLIKKKRRYPMNLCTRRPVDSSFNDYSGLARIRRRRYKRLSRMLETKRCRLIQYTKRRFAFTGSESCCHSCHRRIQSSLLPPPPPPPPPPSSVALLSPTNNISSGGGPPPSTTIINDRQHSANSSSSAWYSQQTSQFISGQSLTQRMLNADYSLDLDSTKKSHSDLRTDQSIQYLLTSSFSPEAGYKQQHLQSTSYQPASRRISDPKFFPSSRSNPPHPLTVRSGVNGGVMPSNTSGQHTQSHAIINVPDAAYMEYDTQKIATSVREMLSTNNIGQRVFARHVLGLSQGTVSELLSKPKPWNKLTEKGRESYKKMWNWANYPGGIVQLKAFSPRKDQGTVSSSSNPLQSASGSNNALLAPDTSPGVIINGILSEAIDHKANGTSKYRSLHDRLESPETIQRIDRILVDAGRQIARSKLDSDHQALITAALSHVSQLQQSTQGHHPPAPSSSMAANNVGMIDNAAQLSNSSPAQSSQCAMTSGRRTHNALQQPHNSSGRTMIKMDDIALQSQYIDTENLVKGVKHYLSTHCISQRAFGEVVLGLSQGSVSDLLARPKPWSALTQKGREPFLRMKAFLDNPEAYERLFNRQGNPQANTTPNGRSSSYSIAVKSEIIDPIPPKRKSPLNYTSVRATSADQFDNCHQRGEMVASISTDSLIEIDTEDVSRKVKEILARYQIGQRLFGETVLNLSQGTVSELLSKPKPWKSLSAKGREPYQRMQSWLNVPGNIQRLVKCKLERSGNQPTAMQQSVLRSAKPEPKRRCLELPGATIWNPSSSSNPQAAVSSATNINNIPLSFAIDSSTSAVGSSSYAAFNSTCLQDLLSDNISSLLPKLQTSLGGSGGSNGTSNFPLNSSLFPTTISTHATTNSSSNANVVADGLNITTPLNQDEQNTGVQSCCSSLPNEPRNTTTTMAINNNNSNIINTATTQRDPSGRRKRADPRRINRASRLHDWHPPPMDETIDRDSTGQTNSEPSHEINDGSHVTSPGLTNTAGDMEHRTETETQNSTPSLNQPSLNQPSSLAPHMNVPNSNADTSTANIGDRHTENGGRGGGGALTNA